MRSSRKRCTSFLVRLVSSKGSVQSWYVGYSSMHRPELTTSSLLSPRGRMCRRGVRFDTCGIVDSVSKMSLAF